MKTKPTVIGLVIVVIIAIVGIFVGVVLGRGEGEGDIAVKVPVNAQGADDVGALHIELAYDPAVLNATGVEKGTLASNAMMEFSVDTPGRVWVGMIDAAGMNGDGSLVEVSFEVLGQDETTSPLTLEKLAAWDATNIFDIPTEASPGSFTVKNRLFTAPAIIFAP